MAGADDASVVRWAKFHQDAVRQLVNEARDLADVHEVLRRVCQYELANRTGR